MSKKNAPEKASTLEKAAKKVDYSREASEVRRTKLLEDHIAAQHEIIAELKHEIDDLMMHPITGVFTLALEQITKGKGEERHGGGKDFLEQPWVALADTHGIGFLTGQAAKKLGEAQSMFGEAWQREMLGVINYAAMAVMYNIMREYDEQEHCLQQRTDRERDPHDMIPS